MLNPVTFGSLMVRMGDADALIGGSDHALSGYDPAGAAGDSHRPELRRVAGVYMLITPKGDIYFLADATVNIEPTAEDLAEIAIMAAEKARRFRHGAARSHAFLLEFRQHARIRWRTRCAGRWNWCGSGRRG